MLSKLKTSLQSAARRAAVLVGVVGLALTGIIPLFSGSASAASYTQLTARNIQLSDSSTSGTAVSYNVGFTTSAAYTVNTVVIEICNGATGPFVAAACTTPDATFNWNKATATIGTQVGITGMTVDTTDSTANKLVLTRTAGLIGASTAVTFPVNGVTNPSTLGTYYARIYTLNNATGNTTGVLQDAGGIALSTANVINVTAKVQESLTFCAYTTNATCATATGTALSIGDGNGVLSGTTSDYTANSFFNIYSNATTGVDVRLKGNTLTSGANTIAAQGAGTCTADSVVASVEQFGLRVVPGTGATANVAPDAYNCGAGSHDLEIGAVNGTTSTYGSLIASTAGPTAEMQNTVEYNAKAATTTKAGIYTAAMTFIATGKY
jgi:hypothetical protein